MTENNNKPDTEERLEDILEKNFKKSRENYYRHVLRKEDQATLNRIQKIPDNWDKFEENKSKDSPVITDAEKRRLSDIKKQKSWELKFEGINIYYLINIEDTLMSCLKHKELTEDELNEAKDSLNNIITNVEGASSNFKNLLLSLAKRAISDLYYLMISYRKYQKKNNNNFDSDFKEFCKDLHLLFDEYILINKKLSSFIYFKEKIDPMYSKSSNQRGWKINESIIKEYLNDQTNEDNFSIIELKRAITTAYLYKKRMKSDFEFVKYYYNDKDGKHFRYNFVVNTMSEKLKENKVNPKSFEAFHDIQENFILMKNNFIQKGIKCFGPRELSYLDLVEFIYKGVKIIEFHSLRESQYEELQNLRNEILYYIEKEYFKLHPEINRDL